LLDSYLDGEHEPYKMLEIEEHVADCNSCREEVQLLRAIRGSLKHAVKTSAPVSLRDRIGAAMAAERLRSAAVAGSIERSQDAGQIAVSGSWRSMVPLAAAAALALAWGAGTRGVSPSTVAKEAHAGFGDDLLRELVLEHTQPLPPEATDLKTVRGFERYVGVPMHPGGLERAGAHLVGGRIVPLHAQRAAILQYVMDDARRVSVLVYDSDKIRIGSEELAPRAIGNAEVRVGRQKGYSVAATERAGQGYLLVSDLDPDKNAQLAAMAYDDR
jgi:anti-sigma factor RsiW